MTFGEAQTAGAETKPFECTYSCMLLMKSAAYWRYWLTGLLPHLQRPYDGAKDEEL